METFKSGTKFAVKYGPAAVRGWSFDKSSDKIKLQNKILYDCYTDVSGRHAHEILKDDEYVLIGVVFYKSGTNSFISVPEIFAGYMVMELVAIDEVKRIHVGADKIAKAQER